jgi:hypothetical protein
MSAVANGNKPNGSPKRAVAKRVQRSHAELANQYNRNLTALLERAAIPKGKPGSMVHRSTNRSVSVRAESLRKKRNAARNRATKKNAANREASAKGKASAAAKANAAEQAPARRKQKAEERKNKEASLLALSPRSMARQINEEAAEATRKRLERSAKNAENARAANAAAIARIEELATKKKELLRRKAELEVQGRQDLEEKCAALQRLKNREAQGK